MQAEKQRNALLKAVGDLDPALGEAALLESKRFLRSTLDALSSHIAILDERGTIIEVNAAWNRFAVENYFLRGCGLGDNYLKVCDSASGNFSKEAPIVARGIRAIIAGRSDGFNLEYPCHGPKEKRWFHVRVTCFGGDGPVRVVVAHENITGRKQIEARFRRLADSNVQGVIFANMKGEIIKANDAFLHIVGYTRKDMEAGHLNWAALSPPEYAGAGHHDLHDTAAKSYLQALAENKSVLLVAPTWNEIETVTEKVREELKSSGHLALEEMEFQVFDSLSWTEAQKRDARQYRPGMAIHFHRRGHGFEKGETVAVVAVANDSLKVQRADGSENIFPLGAGIACDVGEKRKLKVAAGDKLLLQANAVAVRKHFVNGELVEVKAVQGDSVLLADGRVIPVDYRTFTHGYAVTSHTAQGKTVDEVLLVVSSRSLAAINQEQFYVSISRGRERCQIFTDDSDLLRSHVTRSSARLAAVEAMPQRDFLQTILQRGNRFLKQFRQRIAQSLLIETTERSSHEIKPTEQRKSTGINV